MYDQTASVSAWSYERCGLKEMANLLDDLRFADMSVEYRWQRMAQIRIPFRTTSPQDSTSPSRGHIQWYRLRREDLAGLHYYPPFPELLRLPRVLSKFLAKCNHTCHMVLDNTSWVNTDFRQGRGAAMARQNQNRLEEHGLLGSIRSYVV